MEYQAVTLAKYTIELQEDHKHLRAVKNPRLQETPFHSPQLTLFDLGPGEWLLYWKIPDQAPGHRKRRVRGSVQLPLFDLPPIDLAVGAEEGSGAIRPLTHLHPVPKQPIFQETEE